MRKLGWGLALLVATCSGAVAASDPVALVKSFYDTWDRGQQAVNWMDFTSRRLRMLTKAAQKRDEMWLDSDPVVDGQDAKVTGLKLEKLQDDGCRAVVEATFKNFDEPRRVRFELVLEKGAWRVSDIVEAHSGMSRVTTLAAGKPVPPEKPTCAAK